MSDTLLVALRFYDANDDNPSSEDDLRNTYFRVRFHSKFGLVARKFGQLMNFNPNDLTFYHKGHFLSPTQTIKELNLTDNCLILIKKLIPVTLEFIEEGKSLYKQFFRLLDMCVSLKVEEDSTFLSLYLGVLTHLKVLESEAKEKGLSIDKVRFQNILWVGLRQTVTSVSEFEKPIHDIGVGANSHIVISCSPSSYTVICGYLGRLNKYYEKAQASASVQESAEQLQAALSEKATLVNTLQTEKKSLAAELAASKEQVSVLSHSKLLMEEEIKLLKSQNSELETSKKELEERCTKTLSVAHEEHLSSLSKLKLAMTAQSEAEKKLKANLMAFLDYFVKSYNQVGLWLFQLNLRLAKSLERLESAIRTFNENNRLASEINLEPIDFDYLKILVSEARVPQSFQSVKDIQELMRQVKRPYPEQEFLMDSPPLTKIFVALFNDEQMKGLSVKEICYHINESDLKFITSVIQGYLNMVETRKPQIRYNLVKKWSQEKDTAVYIYPGLVDWCIPFSSQSFQPIQLNELKNFEDFLRYNVLLHQNIGTIIKSHLEAFDKAAIEILNNSVIKHQNMTKNLVQVLDQLQNVKNERIKYAKDRHELITHFQREMAISAHKIQFVANYDQKLNYLAKQIEQLRNEKLKFERDNNIYARFYNNRAIATAGAGQVQSSRASFIEATTGQVPFVPVQMNPVNSEMHTTVEGSHHQTFPQVNADSSQAFSQAPTQPSTQVPKQSPTQLSMQSSFQAATPASTKASTNASTQAPTNSSTQAPTQAQSRLQSQKPLEASSVIQPPTSKQAVNLTEDPIKATAKEPIDTQAQVSAKAPIEIPSEAPVEILNKVPIEIPDEAPTTEARTTEAPVEVSKEAAVEIVTKSPVEVPKEPSKVSEETSKNGDEKSMKRELESEYQPTAKKPRVDDSLKTTDTGSGSTATKPVEYINIRVDFENNGAAQAYFKLKTGTKLKKVLKSYRNKLSANKKLKYLEAELNSLRLKIGGNAKLDYSKTVKELGVKNLATIKAFIP